VGDQGRRRPADGPLEADREPAGLHAAPGRHHVRREPAEGFFQDASFRHPDMAFRMDFRRGGRAATRSRPSARSAERGCHRGTATGAGPNAQQAAQKFFTQQGIEQGQSSRRQIGGYAAVTSTFRVQTEQGYLRGLVAWIDYQERVFQILGYTPEARWNRTATCLPRRSTVSAGRPTRRS